MTNWETLYAVLKNTREGNDNQVLEDLESRKYIADSITKKDIENMSKNELDEAVISYLQVIVPELK